MQVLALLLKITTVLTLFYVNGVNHNSSLIDGSYLQFEEHQSHIDMVQHSSGMEEQNHGTVSYKCHGQASCENQTVPPALNLVEIQTVQANLFLATVSKDRSVYTLHPEPPPPEALAFHILGDNRQKITKLI